MIIEFDGRSTHMILRRSRWWPSYAHISTSFIGIFIIQFSVSDKLLFLLTALKGKP